MKRYELMIPGPVPVEPEVLQACAEPLVAHYGAEWTEFYLETLELLKKVLQTQGEVFLIPGSGSAGLDAMTESLLGHHRKALVMSGGPFGERLYEITRSHTDQAAVVRVPAGQPIKPDLLEETLRKDPAEVVLVVHCETSAGVLNPVKELNAVCREHDCLLAVDAVSSLGGAPLPLDEWKIEACVTATQKCLGVPPGFAVVAVSPKAWKLVEQSDVRGWYLNLRIWKDYAERWLDWHPYPVTISTGLVEALRKSLELILSEGLETRFRRHAEVAAFLRQELRNLGLQVLAPEEYASPTVTAVLTDGRLQIEELRNFLKRECNILIAGGSGALRDKTFRIGHMGLSANKERIVTLLSGIEKAMKSQGIEVPHGSARAGQ